MKTTICAFMAALLAALVLAAPAAEAKPKPRKATELTLTVSFAGQSAGGKVKSVEKCRSGRRVVLYEAVNGSTTKVARTRSKPNGSYAFEGLMISPVARYEAVTFQKPKRRIVCRGANSPRVTAGPVG